MSNGNNSGPPALASADISISPQGASRAAMDAADIIFLDGGLARIVDLYAIARDLDRTLKGSFGLILVPNSMALAGALAGAVGFRSSLILNNFFNVLATSYAMRIHTREYR